MKKTNNPEETFETLEQAARRLLQGMDARKGRPSKERPPKAEPSSVSLKAFGVVIRFNLRGGVDRNGETNAGYVRLCVQANDAEPLWAFEDEPITLDDYDW